MLERTVKMTIEYLKELPVSKKEKTT